MKTDDVLTRIGQSITLKVIVLGFLILLLILPTVKIQRLIDERSSRRDEVIEEVTDKWGSAQTISGPVLVLPCTEMMMIDKKLTEIRKNLYLFPEVFNAKGEIIPEVRYRSLYKVIVYNSTLELEGTFDLSEISRLQVPPESIEWGKACLQLGITDTRGIQNEIALEWSGQNCSAEPGLINDDIALSGITIKVPVTPDDRVQPFSMKMEIRGSEWFHIVPSGKTTKVRLTSPWTTPSFTGAFLPDKREIGPSGFDAEWEVFHLNRSFPQVWIDQTYSLDESSFGLSLLFPTDEYQKSTRSVKYAILFIALTFLIFVLIEVINHRKVHPVQYLLVSFGLLIFYTLLVSLSEHLGFNLAYLVSGISVVGLITIYTYSIFKKVSLTLLMGSSLTALYIFLFVILQLQDFALLIGSIGLFVILGLVMLLTRKISWYRTSDQ